MQSYASSFTLWLQNKYKENYTNHMKGHYEGGGIDKKTMHAMNVRKLASDVRKIIFFPKHIISPIFFKWPNTVQCVYIFSNNIWFQISYKSEYEQEKNVQGEYNYPATITPSYQSQKKLEPLKDVSLSFLLQL